MPAIRYTAEDLDAFRLASHDRNPLHLSEDYARRTAFGGRVVFGVLSGLYALGQVADRPGTALARINLDFSGAATEGVAYAAEVDEINKARAAARIQDGQRPLLDASFQFRAKPAAPEGDRPAPVSAPPPRVEAIDRSDAEMAPETMVSGTYAPSWPALAALLDRTGCRQSFIDPVHMAVLLWSSYLVGMELPGRRALFGSLAVELHAHGAPLAPFDYEARVVGTTPRGEHRIAAKITAQGRPIADVTITALTRDEAVTVDAAVIRDRIGASQALAGKVAVISGASRGLGAAIAQALALQGATVIATYQKSHAEAEAIRDAVKGAPGEIRIRRGDAGDAAFWGEIAREHPAIDLLVLSASPPIKPLWIEPCAVERIDGFILESVRMVSAPLAAILPALAKRRGSCALISSSYVSEIPRDFPHYNAAKAAAEALVRTAIAEARAVSGIIVRPPKLLTDQTNTPFGRKGAIAIEGVAAAIAAHLMGPSAPGKVEVIDQLG